MSTRQAVIAGLVLAAVCIIIVVVFN